MTEFAARQLANRMERPQRWPIPAEAPVRALINLWVAFRESNDTQLRRVAEWPADRPYVIDNLPEKIAEAFGSMMYGEDPDFTAGADGDQARLDELVEVNGLPSALRDAEAQCVAEGETWWRISTNPDATPHALLTFHSRADVVPLLHGRNVVAVAFVSQLPPPAGDPEQTKNQVWRHVEIQSYGRTENRLYLGRRDALGGNVALARHPETANLREVWQHDIPAVLAGRIVNKFGRRPHVGVSDYQGVWTQFLVLNEATTIGRENMRLTAKRRVVVPQSAVKRAPENADRPLVDRGDGSMVPVTPKPTFDAGEDVLVADPLEVEEGRDNTGPFRVLEYSFEAEQLIAYMRHTVETVCVRCDIVPQFIGQGDFGQGDSGTALRVRLLPTVNANEGKARPWDDQLPTIVSLMALVESMPIALGGLGRPWTDPAARPAIQRENALPEDPSDVARRHSDLKTADLISIEQSIRERHPDWSDDDVSQEIDRIRQDQQATMPAIPSPAGGGGPPSNAGGGGNGGGGPGPPAPPGPGG